MIYGASTMLFGAEMAVLLNFQSMGENEDFYIALVNPFLTVPITPFPPPVSLLISTQCFNAIDQPIHSKKQPRILPMQCTR